MYLHAPRNEQDQEELWKRSIAVLRDHLSPEVLEKYGPPVSTEKKEEEGTTAAEGVESKEGEKEEEEGLVVSEEPETTPQPTQLEVEVHAVEEVGGCHQSLIIVYYMFV